MIVFFHMAYVIASSLMNIISSSLFNADVAQRKVNDDDIQEEDQMNKPVPGPSDEISQMMQQMDGKASSQGLGLGLHDEEQTTDDSSLTQSPNCIQGDGQGYLTAQPYVSADFENEDCEFEFRPIPPVYAQRYLAVKSVLLDEKWKGQIKKVIDFGCNDLAFFQYVKHMKGVEEVLMVDIDETLLKQSSCRAAPLNCDYLGCREKPLSVQVLGGSIAEQDNRLIGTDAVICIELIEHLWPDEVEAVPYTVFGFVLPKVAIFTTPNADFNVVFKNFSGFRHPDHKFEWTREQFECWANNIVQRYPAYEVTFHGIGAGPPGTEVYGCCSQMAVFVKRVTDNQQAEIESGEVYKLICNYDYPYRVDSRTTEERIRHEAEYYIHLYSKDEVHCVEDGEIEIPLATLLPHVEMWCVSVDELRRILEGDTWKISDRDPEAPAVVYPYFSAYSSSDEGVEEGEGESVNRADDDCLRETEEDWDAKEGSSSRSNGMEDKGESKEAVNSEPSAIQLFRSEVASIESITMSEDGMSCVRSIDEATMASAAQVVDFIMETVDFLTSRPMGASVSLENHASGSVDSLPGSDSSRSFFAGLLSQERHHRMDQESDEDSDDSEGSESSWGGRGASPPRRPAQPHRNHLPFGLVAVENGDVANNNRDGEGNNAIPDEDDDLLPLPLLPPDEAGDVEDFDDLDDDLDNANDPVLLPDGADPFPPWLLHLLQVANDDGIELGAAGEPHIFLGDL